MASQERIEQLEGFASDWRDLLQESQRKCERLMSLIKNLDATRDKDIADLFQKQIAQESNAANEYQKALTFIESTLALARSGHDV